MTSLKSWVKVILMKKLSLYIFLFLMWCNACFANLIIFSDIKVGEKISKYLNDQEISQYYKSDTKDNGVLIYDKDKKYSYLLFLKEDGIFKGNYEYYQIFYENSTNKIVGTAGVYLMDSKDKDLCLKKRNDDVDIYKRGRITSLFNKTQDKHTFPDGVVDDYIMFSSDEKYIAFACLIHSDKVQYRVEEIEHDYNDYIYKIYNQ